MKPGPKPKYTPEEKRLKTNESNRKWRAKNREHTRAYQRKYQKEYRQKHLEKIRERQMLWERKNRSVRARQQGIYKKPGLIPFEVKHADPGKPFIVRFD